MQTQYPKCISPCGKLNLEPLTPDERFYHHERIAIMCENGPVTDEAKKQGVKDVLRFRKKVLRSSANLGPILEGVK